MLKIRTRNCHSKILHDFLNSEKIIKLWIHFSVSNKWHLIVQFLQHTLEALFLKKSRNSNFYCVSIFFQLFLRVLRNFFVRNKTKKCEQFFCPYVRKKNSKQEQRKWFVKDTLIDPKIDFDEQFYLWRIIKQTDR